MFRGGKPLDGSAASSPHLFDGHFRVDVPRRLKTGGAAGGLLACLFLCFLVSLFLCFFGFVVS